MKFEGELRRRENRRNGPGWWMDVDGQWRAPEHWPEDTPPLPGWVPNGIGGWMEPAEPTETRWTRAPEEPVFVEPQADEPKRASRQARADKRAMLLVTGILFGVMLLLVGAMILINQAGALNDEEPSGPQTTTVIYAAETDDALQAERLRIAGLRPAAAVEELAQLRPRQIPADAPAFAPEEWAVVEDGCLSITEQVLVARSRSEVSYIDDMECVLDGGTWADRAHGTTVRSVIDAEVVSFVPLENAWRSGGWNWTAQTKANFASDLSNPATLQVVAAGFGHNPRAQDPSEWKPAARSQWCGYATDWIGVKHRWNLSVTVAERNELTTMLATCAEPGSAGADPATVVLSTMAPPAIGLLRP